MYVQLNDLPEAPSSQTVLPSFEFPIRSPQEIVSLFPNGKVLLFGYGSLLNRESALRHLSQEAVDSSRLTVAFGARRVFDREVGGPTHWGIPEKPNDTGMLNVQLTDDPEDMVNGVVMELSEADLWNAIQRETGYDLVPVPVILWDEVFCSDAPQVFYAYTFRASTEPREGKVYTSSRIDPIPGYARASKAGAAQHGDRFLEFWLETTFLADGQTPFSCWEENRAIDLFV